MKRIGLVVPVCALLAGSAACSHGAKQNDPPSASTPVPSAGALVVTLAAAKLSQIRVARVESAEVPKDEVDAPGKVEVNPHRVSHVVLPLAGRIKAVMARLGDAVEQGQPLLSIESPDADAALASHLQAQAGVSQARAALVKAQADLDRARDLFEHNAVARKEVLSAENAAAQAQAAVDQTVAVARQALRRLEILGLRAGEFGQVVQVRAPIAGKVMELTVAPGEYRNDTNASLMTIADLSTVWVSADVPESAIRLITPGERVEVEMAAYPGQTFRGKVARISDAVDPQTRTLKVQAEMENPGGRFRPEMFARIRHVHSTRTLPVVPAGAVVQGEGKSFVWREISSGSFVQAPVTLGQRLGDRLPILEGLRPGDRVVVDGAMLIRN